MSLAVEPALWRLALLLVAAFAAPALCSDTGKNDEGFFGLDEAGNMAMHAQDGKDVRVDQLQLLPSASPLTLIPLGRCTSGRGGF